MQHKCFKCGTEFDGNFCPECGAKWLEAKTCPKCGATLAGNAKFCNECGYSFISTPQPQKPAATPPPQPAATPTQKATPTPKPAFHASIDREKAKLYAVCLYLPYVLIALFSVLFFFFYLAPVAVMPGGELFGETIPSESYGNIYQMTSGEMFPALAGSSIACIIFAAFLLADALFCLYVAVIRHDTRGAKPLAILGHGLIAALLIIGCVMMGIVGKEDGGMGMISVGAAPILIVVFSSLDIALWIAAECVRNFIVLNTPEGAKSHAEKVALRKNNREKRRAETVYRYQMARYQKGKSYENASYSRAWLYVHRIAVSVTAVALAVVITVTCVVATRDRRFRAESLVKIGLGADEARVIEVLGEPSVRTSTTWYYYSKNFVSLQEDFAALEEKMMDAESMEELEKLYNESEKLDEKMKTIEYQWISVEFSIDNKVYEMVLDTTAVYEKKQEKAVESIVVLQEGESEENFYSYRVDAPLSYAILYQDGSYWKGYISASQLPTKSGVQTIQWSNEWGSYSVTITVAR